jgi:hypothetical protein
VLQVDSGATVNLSLADFVQGTIDMNGGVLNTAIKLSEDAYTFYQQQSHGAFPLIVTGFGTANVNIFDVQTFLPLKVEANGGTLEFKQAIPVYGLPQIEIADTGNSVLKFDSAFDNSLNHAPHYVPISWDGASGQLDVSDG